MKRFLFVAVVALTYLFANGCVIVVPRGTPDETEANAPAKAAKSKKRHKRTNVQAENDATDRLLDKDQRPYYVALRAGK